MTSLSTTSIIVTVITQHAEEAGFLWLLRDDAVGAPHYDLEDLRGLDERVAAHLDGLRIADEPGWHICKEHFLSGESGEVFAAGVLAFESDEQHRIREVVDIGTSSRELSKGLVAALGWLSHDTAAPHVRTLLQAEQPLSRRAAIAAMAVHRVDPGEDLIAALSGDDDVVRSRALRAVGELGRTDLVRVCRGHLQDDEEACRLWAAWSGARLGDGPSVNHLQQFAEGGGLRADMACDLVARTRQPGEANAWREGLARTSESHRMAIVAAGAIGDVGCMPWLMEMMQVDDLARPAGEAFSSITGVDLAYDDLERDWPDGFEAGPTEDPEDENVDMDPDEDLPWPDPELIARWWHEHRAQFEPGTRYLLGKPMTEPNLQEALRFGKQRQRAAAALELALLSPETPLFEVRARGDRQMQQLGITLGDFKARESMR